VLPARQQEEGSSRRAAWFIGKLASPDTKILGLYESSVGGGSSHVRRGAGKPTGPRKSKRPKRKGSRQRGGGEARTARDAKVGRAQVVLRAKSGNDAERVELSSGLPPVRRA
jgi:hypothetical protein